jgi:cytochrome c oxidase subunit II
LKGEDMFRKFSFLLAILLTASLLLAACGTDDGPSPQFPEDEEVPETGVDLMQIGQQVYINQCASCHMDNGLGQLPQFPALDGNELVIGDPHPVIEIVLHGRGAMPPFENVLTDEEIAGVVTYIRGAWTNMAPPVEPQTVQDAR